MVFIFITWRPVETPLPVHASVKNCAERIVQRSCPNETVNTLRIEANTNVLQKPPQKARRLPLRLAAAIPDVMTIAAQIKA